MMRDGSILKQEKRTLDCARYNENTVGICTSINKGTISNEKRDYSVISLISMMHENGILKNELVKESFEEAEKITKLYEEAKSWN